MRTRVRAFVFRHKRTGNLSDGLFTSWDDAAEYVTLPACDYEIIEVEITPLPKKKAKKGR
jgi:hypothetical protein